MQTWKRFGLWWGILLGCVFVAGSHASAVTPGTRAFELAVAGPLTLAAVPGFDEQVRRIALVPAGENFDASGLVVTGNASWLAAAYDATTRELVLTFTTRNLVSAANAAMVTVTNGAVVRTLAVTAGAAPLNLVRLADDPVRSRMYGVQQNGVQQGAIVAFNPLDTSPVASVSVGARPTDLDVSPDGAELAVICSAAPAAIWIIDLATLAVRETIPLAAFDNWDVNVTTARVAFGPGGVLYYTDAAWAPALRVLRRSDRAVLQLAYIDAIKTAPENSPFGFGDIVVSPDRASLYGWGQYGWSAGASNSLASRFSIAADGRLAHVSKGPAVLQRDPLDTPALVSADGAFVFLKQNAYAAANFAEVAVNYTDPVYAISPGGEIVVTRTAIRERLTGNTLHTLATPAVVQAVTSDYARLVGFDSVQRRLTTLNLVQTVGDAILGRDVRPADGAVVTPPAELRWSALPGVDRYHVYLGDSAAAVAAATPASSEYMGLSTGPVFALDRVLSNGRTYHWRVDAVLGSEITPGAVRAFTVASIATSLSRIDTTTVRGHARHAVSVELSAGSAESWTASSSASWIDFEADAGTTPATLRVVFDASALAPGVHQSTVTLTTATGAFSLPVALQVDPLALTRMVTSPGSTRVYALSEAGLTWQTDGARAYLLEIDTLREKITRVTRVGKGATDLAVHPDDGRVYVSNWRIGQLLAVDLNTFAVVRTYGVPGFSGVGYSDDDIYRLSAGGPGRLVVEAADQWIHVSLFDTLSGQVVATTSQRQGDGAYAPDLRHYYHGDSNSSGAALTKFDTTGDRFTWLKSARAVGLSYYGSRTVLVSDDGETVTWNGVVFDADLGVRWTLTEEILELSADGRYVFTRGKIYDALAQRLVANMPVVTDVMAYNSITGRLVTGEAGALGFYVLPGVEVPGRLRDPLDGSTILPRATLGWTGLSGAEGYHVYLGDSAAAVAAATPDSPEYLGLHAAPSLTLTEALAAGRTYFWRVDFKLAGEVVPGAVQSFQVAALVPGVAKIDVSTVRGHADFAAEIPLASVTPGAAWTATSDRSWIQFVADTGATPANIQVRLDASAISVGEHTGSVTVNAQGSSVVIPVTLRVDPLVLTVLRSDPDSDRVFAISEQNASPSLATPRAYLLEIDTAQRRIARVVRAGTSATDLAVHPGDDRVYVTNWKLGRLLAFERDTLALADTFDVFTPPGSYRNDVYRISAGGPGRLVVEGENQWVNVSILDTRAGRIVATTSQREGGGVHDLSGRYYYHGDNNISNASLHRFDTTGDVFTPTVSLRTTGFSEYGSRTVVRSEDGARVFWNGSVFTVEPFAEEWVVGEEILAVSADGRVAFARQKVYDLDARSAVITRFAGGAPLAYNSASDILVSQIGAGLVFQAVGYELPLLTPVASVGPVTHGSVVLLIPDTNLRTAYAVEQRVAGEQVWRSAVSAPHGALGDTQMITGLAPETAYEFRVRALNPYGDSPWSESVSALTTAVPPQAPSLDLKTLHAFALGGAFSLALPTDQGSTYVIEGLPPGLVFDPATGVISGTITQAGRYTMIIGATNAGGSAHAYVAFEIRSVDSDRRTASHSGLVGGDEGVVGRWTLTRTDLGFSGKLITNAGTLTLRGRFVENRRGEPLVAVVGGRLSGLDCMVRIEWDRTTNNMSLRLSSEYFHAETLEDTGYAAFWHARQNPYPGPGRYHALLAPVATAGDAAGDEQPAGRGFVGLKINTSGGVSITGRTALGQPLTFSATIPNNHLLPIYLGNAAGLHWGVVAHAAPELAGPELEGVLGWVLYEKTRSTLYPRGFERTVRIVGSRYASFANHAVTAAAGADFVLRLGGAELERVNDGDALYAQAVTLDAKTAALPKRGTEANPRSARLVYSASTGSVTGTAVFHEFHPVTGRRIARSVAFQGLAVTDIDGRGTFYAGGYFLLPGPDGLKRSGWMEFTRTGTDYRPEVSEGFYDDTPGSVIDDSAGVGGTGSLGGSLVIDGGAGTVAPGGTVNAGATWSFSSDAFSVVTLPVGAVGELTPIAAP